MIQRKLAVRPLVEADAPYLYKWLNDSRVLAYYEGRDRPHDMHMIRENFLVKTGDNDVSGFLVLLDITPIGYVQTYPVQGEELLLYGYHERDRVFGMDQFIGEPDLWNQGIGTELVRMVAHELIHTSQAKFVVMDPRVENVRAIHVYEKCGFMKKKLLRARELHEGEFHDCWLMELESKNAEKWVQ